MIFIYIVLGIVSLIIYFYFLRAAVKANENILLQKAQVKLLASIALKVGVSLEDINKDTKGIELNEAVDAPELNNEHLKLKQRYDKGEIVFEEYQKEWEKLNKNVLKN